MQRVSLLFVVVAALLATTAKADARSASWVVAKIEAQNASGSNSFGSGLLLGYSPSTLYIATAAHNLYPDNEVATAVKIRFAFYDDIYYANTYEELDDSGFIPFPDDSGSDVAILEVPMNSRLLALVTALDFEILGDDAFIAYTDSVNVIGNPAGTGVTPAGQGRFQSRLGERIEFESNSVVVGFSGGGLFDERWRLIGMVTQRDPPIAKASRVGWIVQQKQAEMTVHLTRAASLKGEVEELVFKNAATPEAKEFLSWIRRTSIPLGDKRTRYLVNAIDLNADSNPEWVVQVSDDRWCGSGGCEWNYGIYTKNEKGFEALADIECGRTLWVSLPKRPSGGFARIYCEDVRDYYATEISQRAEPIVMTWTENGYEQLAAPMDIGKVLPGIDADAVSVTPPPVQRKVSPVP